MDNFAEQLVKKQMTGSERLKTIILMVGGALLTLLLIVTSLLTLGSGIFTFIGLLLSVATAFGTYRIFRNTKVEYEYAYTNGELDVDKIIAQKKRVEMLTVDVSKFTAFGKYDENTSEETKEMTLILATDNLASHEYYADFQSAEYGSARLVFVPNEKMLENIKRGLSPQLRRKLNDEQAQ